MAEKWRREGRMALGIPNLWNDYVPKHLLPRLHGYELLMAPYAIAHLKIGLKLYETGYNFGSDERARVYLTNALEPAQDFSGHLAFAIPALAHEAEAVNKIKRDQQFTVVIGNPPYSVSSINKSPYIESLMDVYKLDVRHEPNIKPLSDDYVKFFRLAHHLVGSSPCGIIGFITNNSFLWGPIFLGMRRRLIADFNVIQLLNLHGDSLSGETTPTGDQDKNVFDIRQGVAITLSIESPFPSRSPRGAFIYDIYGAREAKYHFLEASSAALLNWMQLNLQDSRTVFVRSDDTHKDEYHDHLSLTAVFPTHSKPILTKRDHITIHFKRDSLLETLRDFCILPHSEFSEKYGLQADSRDWKYNSARQTIEAFGIKDAYVQLVDYRPFDPRWTYYVNKTKGFMAYPVYNIMSHMLKPNLSLCIPRQVNQPPWRHVIASARLTEFCYISNKTREQNDVFPLYLYDEESNQLSLAENDVRHPNLSVDFLEALAVRLHLPQSAPDNLPEGITPEDIFFYTYAVFHCPGYCSRYAEFLRIDYPRLPLTSSLELFRWLSELGGELVALHVMESPKLDEYITTLIGLGEFQVEKVSYVDGIVWIDKAKTRGFRGVPEEVWNFHIGGYQVCHKWLKDRQAKGGKNPRPGRVLTDQDINHYQKIVVALSETIRLMQDIDEVINLHGGWPDAFQVETGV